MGAMPNAGFFKGRGLPAEIIKINPNQPEAKLVTYVAERRISSGERTSRRIVNSSAWKRSSSPIRSVPKPIVIPARRIRSTPSSAIRGN